MNSKENQGRKGAQSLGKWGLSLFLLAGLWIFPRAVQSQQLISNFTTGDVSYDPRSRSESVPERLREMCCAPAWPGSRHVFYDHGIGQVFVFYSQPYGIAYRSYNFSSWSNESVVISTGNALALDPSGATNSNTMYSSVYYDQTSSSVYVIASDPNIGITYIKEATVGGLFAVSLLDDLSQQRKHLIKAGIHRADIGFQLGNFSAEPSLKLRHIFFDVVKARVNALEFFVHGFIDKFKRDFLGKRLNPVGHRVIVAGVGKSVNACLGISEISS